MVVWRFATWVTLDSDGPAEYRSMSHCEMLDGMVGGYAMRQTTAYTAHYPPMALLMLCPPWVQLGQAQIAAGGGAGRRSAKIAAAPLDQSCEAHRSARPLHSPEGGHEPQAAGS